MSFEQYPIFVPVLAVDRPSTATSLAGTQVVAWQPRSVWDRRRWRLYRLKSWTKLRQRERRPLDVCSPVPRAGVVALMVVSKWPIRCVCWKLFDSRSKAHGSRGLRSRLGYLRSRLGYLRSRRYLRSRLGYLRSLAVKAWRGRLAYWRRRKRSLQAWRRRRKRLGSGLHNKAGGRRLGYWSCLSAKPWRRRFSLWNSSRLISGNGDRPHNSFNQRTGTQLRHRSFCRRAAHAAKSTKGDASCRTDTQQLAQQNARLWQDLQQLLTSGVLSRAAVCSQINLQAIPCSSRIP